MFLLICSCGVILFGISMYYLGVYLGLVFVFMILILIINLIVVVFCLGFLGFKVIIIYLIVGFLVLFLVGFLGNCFGKEELLFYNDLEEEVIELEEEKRSFMGNMIDGFKWFFGELVFIISKYVVMGMVFVGFIIIIFLNSII